MRQQESIDAAKRHSELRKPNRRPTSGVNQKPLAASLDECAWPEALRTGDRYPGPQQRDPEVVHSRHWCIFIPESLTTWAQ
jgi:hypothetical protein